MKIAPFAVGLALMLAVPAMAAAQSTDLQSSVRAALAGDPRTASMSQSQIDAMVQALSAQAQSKGITPQDIAWRPVTDAPAAPLVGTCSGPRLLCNMSAAFGITGPDYLIAVWLGITALLLIFILGAVLEYRHFKHLHPKHMPGATQ